MTQREFLSTLNFAEAKKTLIRELGIKDFTLTVKNNRHLFIDLKQINNKILNFIFNNTKKCTLISDKVEVTNDSYKASISLKGPSQFKIGELSYDNGKWNFTKANELSTKTKLGKDIEPSLAASTN